MAIQDNNFKNDLFISRALEKGIFRIEGDRIKYPNGKSYNFKDPEEKVRARTFAQLVLKYDYPINKIDTEIIPPRREPKLPADIVVYDEKEASKVFIVVEVKAEAVGKEMKVALREGLGNSTLLDAKFLFVVCGEEEQVYKVENKPSLKDLKDFRIPTIPIKYGKEIKYKYKRGDKDWDLKAVSFRDLDYKFQRCHDAIWQGGKLDPAQAFDEMSKLMFTKYFDELWNTKNREYYTFQVGTNETEETVSQKIHSLYKEAQKREPSVFSEEITVPSDVIFEVVRVLEDISLKKTDLDAKGRAFEKFLSEIFRGKMGQYFTRREIVDFMVKIINPNVFDYIIDPACGSGGFLLYSWQHVREKLKKDYSDDEENISRLDWDFSHKHIYGIERNDRIARVAMMDMVIHDDGHLNIENNDALCDYSNFDPKKEIKAGKYTCVLTNPPFGSKEKRDFILKNYIFGSRIKRRKSQRVEVLFIERCLELLNKKGRLGIVLPDPVLSNPSLDFVREFILKYTKIIAVISLPQFAFRPVGSGMKTSLLFLGKKEKENDNKDYAIFMGGVEHIGYDSTNRPDKNDLPILVEEYNKFLDDSENYKNIEDEGIWTLKVGFKKILDEGRFDAKYYNPFYQKVIKKLQTCKYELKSIGELVVQPITSGATPRAKGEAYTTPEEGVPFIRIVNVKDGEIILDDVLYIKLEIHNKMLKRTQLKPNDVLVSIAGTIGNTAIVPKNLGEANINQAIALLRLKSMVVLKGKKEIELFPEYIALFLGSIYGKAQMEKISRPGAQANINTTELESILVPVPSTEIQQVMIDEFRKRKDEAGELRLKANEIISSAKNSFEENLLK